MSAAENPFVLAASYLFVAFNAAVVVGGAAWALVRLARRLVGGQA